jgi:hypothetical protein
MEVGQRQRDQTPEQAAQMHFPEHDLKDGHKIELGQTVLQVGVFVPVRCPLCWTEIAEAELPQFHKARCCQACLKKAVAQAPARVPNGVGVSILDGDGPDLLVTWPNLYRCAL